jgi:hypothetical protein
MRGVTLAAIVFSLTALACTRETSQQPDDDPIVSFQTSGLPPVLNGTFDCDAGDFKHFTPPDQVIAGTLRKSKSSRKQPCTRADAPAGGSCAATTWTLRFQFKWRSDANRTVVSDGDTTATVNCPCTCACPPNQARDVNGTCGDPCDPDFEHDPNVHRWFCP